MPKTNYLSADEKVTINKKLKRRYKFIELQFFMLLTLFILTVIQWNGTHNWSNVISGVIILLAMIGVTKKSGLRGLVQLNKSMKELDLNNYKLLEGNCYNKEKRQENKILTLYIVRVIGQDDCTYEVLVNKEVYYNIDNGDVVKFIELDTQLCIYLDVFKG